MTPKFYRFILTPVLAAIVLVSRVQAGATAVEPLQTLRTATDELLAIIYEPPSDGRPLAERARPVIEKYFDFELLTRRAVGPGWRQFTPAQQARITKLLTDLIIRNYCAHFDTSVRSHITFSAPMQLSAGHCELPTTIIYSGQNIAVAYRAEQMSGGWRFYDIIVEGVSLVANYRAQFTELSQRGGADAIVGALEKTLAENPPTK
jgi:phospholipid transport system substrate-binding protein